MIAAASAGFAAALIHPEVFYVVNVIPNSESGETDENSEPSLGVGTGNLYSNLVVHTFSAGNLNKYYTSTNLGTTWTVTGTLMDSDCTLDWSSAGTAYAATLDVNHNSPIRLMHCAGLPGSFAGISGGTLTGSLDQPWVRVLSMSSANPQADHIYIGFNNVANWPGSPYYKGGATGGKTPSVNFSLDGGTTWNAAPGSPSQPPVVIENIATKVKYDSPAVRLALAADGKTVYAIFQRFTDYNGTDHPGDVVLVKDTNSGLDGFTDLNTVVASDVLIPANTTLGPERLGSGCDVAINPINPGQVYVAYTELIGTKPTAVVRLKSSGSGGAGFSLLYSVTNASLPALAVAADDTLGLLLAVLNKGNFEIRFYKWFDTSLPPSIRVLAVFPKDDPKLTWDPYIGDYFTLRAVGYNFYGTFSASGDPDPTHFPSTVFYQRNVRIGGTVMSNFWLAAKGQLVDTSNQAVNYSIDPFFFCDIAPSFVYLPRLRTIPPIIYATDPLADIYHITWPVLPASLPPFLLQTSSLLGPAANWAFPGAPAIIQNNGEFELQPDLSQRQGYFRLSQNLAGAQFSTFAAADSNGQLGPSGIVTDSARHSQTFTAIPAGNYGVANWYLDGAPLQGSTSLTVGNIISEHTLLVTFAPSNDVAVTLTGLAAAPGPALVGNSFEYEVEVANTGLNTATGVTVTNTLDPTVTFVSAATTQGSVTHSGNLVTAAVGTLSQGASALLTIKVIPNTETTITDKVSVACSQFEPNLANNKATNATPVLTGVTITSQPQSVSVSNGATASFSVGAAGTAPLTYQWLFNAADIPGATASTLTLSNVTSANAGSYTVSAFQLLGPEDEVEADSQIATLTVSNYWAPLPPTLLSPGTATDTGYTTFDLMPLFSWTGYPQAASYDLIINQYPYGPGNTVITVGVGTASSYQLPGGILQTGTKYSWYMVSFNSRGDESAHSALLYFQTPIPPTVQSFQPTSVLSNSATFQGFVNPNGSSTTAYFEWGTTTNYGIVTTQTGIGTTARNFSATVSLSSGTTYHYRIDAANGVGLSKGTDIQFNTPLP
jgi:uncharacterized repeat protein (TIGR01451 family)